MYNADAKYASGLDGIRLNCAEQRKWVYAKQLTIAVSAELKSMCHVHSYTTDPEFRVVYAIAADRVGKVMAAVDTNPTHSQSAHHP